MKLVGRVLLIIGVIAVLSWIGLLPAVLDALGRLVDNVRGVQR